MYISLKYFIWTFQHWKKNEKEKRKGGRKKESQLGRKKGKRKKKRSREEEKEQGKKGQRERFVIRIIPIIYKIQWSTKHYSQVVTLTLHKYRIFT